MTEDDTFNRLKRIHPLEMNKIFNRPDNYFHNMEEVDNFLKPHGWTYQELYKELTKNQNEIYNQSIGKKVSG